VHRLQIRAQRAAVILDIQLSLCDHIAA